MTDTDKLTEKHQKELDELLKQQEGEMEELFSDKPEKKKPEPTPKPIKPKEEAKEEAKEQPGTARQAFAQYLEDQSLQDKPVAAPEGKSVAELAAELAQAEQDLAFMTREDPDSASVTVFKGVVERLQKQIRAARRGRIINPNRPADSFADYLDEKDKKRGKK